MDFHLYSQLLKLDRSNDHMLRIYQAFYNSIPVDEKEMAENVVETIALREKIKLKLRSHLFVIRNAIEDGETDRMIFKYLPLFLKVDYLARTTFRNTEWEMCYKKDQQCMKLYLELLYDQNIPSTVIENLLQQKKKFHLRMDS